jgi:hypothetical protein
MESCFADWDTILEYLKVLLSWPPLTIGFLIFLCLRFRGQVGSLIDRIKRVKAFGGEFETNPSAAQLTAAEALPAPPTGTAQAVTLETNPSDADVAAKPTPAPEPIDVVSQDPAKAKAEILKWWSIAKWESVLNAIFGTQLRMLLALAQVPATGETLENLKPFYLEHVQHAGAFAVPQANFQNFLIGNFLMRIEGDRVFITQFGQQFFAHAAATYGAALNTMRAW